MVTVSPAASPKVIVLVPVFNVPPLSAVLPVIDIVEPLASKVLPELIVRSPVTVYVEEVKVELSEI